MSPLRPGLEVEVINGDARGQRGHIVDRWPGDWCKGVPLWLVAIGHDQRPIRADFLKGVGS